MRIKIRNPKSYVSLHEILTIVMFTAFGFCFFFLLDGQFSWQSYTAFVTEISEGDLITLLLFKLLPILMVFFIGNILYRWIKCFLPSHSQMSAIRTIEFLNEGVKLGYNKNTLPVFLPYPETRFSLTITAFDVSTKNGHRSVAGPCVISFTQGNQTFVCDHLSARPFTFFPQLLDYRAQFASFHFAVNPRSLRNSWDKTAADKIRTIFQDYIDYGILCPYDKATRNMLLGLGILLSLFIIQSIVLLNSLTLFALLTLILPLVGIYMICKAVKAKKLAKQIEALKQHKK